jgi:integrase/recombinase XerC
MHGAAGEDQIVPANTGGIDPEYGWAGECEARFGTHPVQVCHEWNTAAHAQEAEGVPAKRAFTLDELQEFFGYADEQAARIRGAGRKGWLPASRDATLFKVAYAYGLRRREVRMLDLADFGRNPKAAEFGEYGSATCGSARRTRDRRPSGAAC